MRFSKEREGIPPQNEIINQNLLFWDKCPKEQCFEALSQVFLFFFRWNRTFLSQETEETQTVSPTQYWFFCQLLVVVPLPWSWQGGTGLSLEPSPIWDLLLLFPPLLPLPTPPSARPVALGQTRNLVFRKLGSLTVLGLISSLSTGELRSQFKWL